MRFIVCESTSRVFFRTFSVGSFVIGLANISVVAVAAKAQRKAPQACIDGFDSSVSLSDYAVEEFTLTDLVSNDANRNPLLKFPSNLLNADQRIARIIEKQGFKMIPEPLYRANKIRFYPIFHSPSLATGFRYIIGQEKAMGHLLGSISQDAHRSEPSGMAFNMRGATGTGKTEALYVVDNLSRFSEGSDPEFYRHTFEWVGLDQIDYLKQLTKSSPGGVFPNQMKRSPLVLLHPYHSKVLHERHADSIRARTGFVPRDRIARDPHTEDIIRAIMKHYMAANKLTSLTADQYLNFLSPHVRIVRRIVSLETPAQVIEHQEVDPRPEQLFIAPNPLRALTYSGTALAYDYTGLVLQQDGGLLVLNEFYRNHPGLRSKFIELMQNRRVDEGGAPPVDLDVVIISADNDESIANAREKTASRASLDRDDPLIVRHLRHPHQIAKTLFRMWGTGNLSYASLEEPEVVSSVTDINQILPVAPASTGETSGTDGKVAVYVTHSTDKPPILIAPHALLLMTATVSASRLVTDPKGIGKALSGLGALRKSPNHRSLVDLTTRLKIILGQISENTPIRNDLYVLGDRLKEGSNGITARDTVRWFRRALMEVESRGSTALTPDIVHEVFKWLLDNDGFVEAKPQNIADWFKMHQMVLKDIVVPALFSDIRSIVSGDAEKVWRIYRQVAAECITLARNENAEEYIDPESQTTLAINRVRLNTIAEVYLNVNHRELVFSDISAAAAAASFSDGRERTSFEPLRQAVEHFLISTELDTTTLESIQAIMKGADRAASKLDLTSISKTFARLGYDEKAFADALSLMIKIRRQTTVK